MKDRKQHQEHNKTESSRKGLCHGYDIQLSQTVLNYLCPFHALYRLTVLDVKLFVGGKYGFKLNVVSSFQNRIILDRIELNRKCFFVILCRTCYSVELKFIRYFQTMDVTQKTFLKIWWVTSFYPVFANFVLHLQPSLSVFYSHRYRLFADLTPTFKGIP